MRVAIHTPFIKLESLLKLAAVVETGGHAKEVILSGDVCVDEKVVYQRGRKVYPGASVSVQGFDETLEVVAKTGVNGG